MPASPSRARHEWIESRRMTARLYWFGLSPPSLAVRKMLELKGIEYDSVTVLVGMQRVHLRLAGFRGGTVPALRLNDRRIQGSRQIARALDQLRPEPALFPAEPHLRQRVEAAERWGDGELQNAPRVLLRWGLVHQLALRRWLAAQSPMPMSELTARTTGPVAWYYARVVGADEARARRVLAALPQMLDRADALLADGTLSSDPPNAATLQVLSSLRALDTFSDLHEMVTRHESAAAARALFPEFPGPIPRFIPESWMRDG
jgi:glutathione S-transferase